MKQQFQLGYSRSVEAISAGEDLGAVFTKMSTTRHTPAGSALYGGALTCLTGAFMALRDAGITFKSDDAEIDKFLAGTALSITADLTQGLNGGDIKQAGRQIGAMCQAVSQCRTWLSWDSVKASDPAPATLNVNIISMPTRETETEIHRDATSKEIIGTVQVVTDSAQG